MKPVVTSITGVGNSPWVPLDQYLTPSDVTIGIEVTGTVTYSVVVTPDNPFTVGSPTSFPGPAGLTAQSANALVELGTLPVAAVQLQVTAGTGTATMTVLQAGIA